MQELEKVKKNRLRVKYNSLHLSYKRALNAQVMCEEGGLISQ